MYVVTSGSRLAKFYIAAAIAGFSALYFEKGVFWVSLLPISMVKIGETDFSYLDWQIFVMIFQMQLGTSCDLRAFLFELFLTSLSLELVLFC